MMSKTLVYENELLETGNLNYLTKPLDVNIFLNTIDEFIEK